MIENNPLVTVIIPTYNEEKNIKNCLLSLDKQSYPNMEIIIIDDGSVDKTKEEISNIQYSLPNYSSPVMLHRSPSKPKTGGQGISNFKLLEQNHRGPATARNKAATVAKGEILVFVDADMTFEKDFVSDLVKPIIEKKYQGTFSKNEYVGNWENVWSRCWNINLNRPDKKMIPDDYPEQGLDFRAVIKSEFERVGGFDDTGYTDTWTLSQKLGYKPHVVSGALYYHNNPDNLKEVFVQSKWVAKRKYKYGLLGQLFALVRGSFPISLIVGIIKSIKYVQPLFLVFKLIFDLAAFIGILEMILYKKLSK